MIQVRQVAEQDLPQVAAIERAGFNEAEAAGIAQFRERFEKIPDTFLVATDQDQVVGFIVGPAVKEQFVTDEMYEHTPHNLPRGGHQMVLSIAVSPAYRGQGIGTLLLNELAQVAKAAGRATISLTSLAKNVPFYQHNGFAKVGVSNSEHAGEVWYDLVKKL